MVATVESPRRSEARTRLLRTASALFYADGIHSVGVDRVVGEARVTRATFYRHFPSKEDLVTAYLEAEDAAVRTMFVAVLDESDDADSRIEAVIAAIAADVEFNHTRGCPFINASAEYPDADSAVRRTVRSHREWFRLAVEDLLRDAGRDDPAEAARGLSLLRDAALVGGYLDGPEMIRETFVAAARTVAGLA